MSITYRCDSCAEEIKYGIVANNIRFLSNGKLQDGILSTWDGYKEDFVCCLKCAQNRIEINDEVRPEYDLHTLRPVIFNNKRGGEFRHPNKRGGSEEYMDDEFLTELNDICAQDAEENKEESTNSSYVSPYNTVNYDKPSKAKRQEIIERPGNSFDVVIQTNDGCIQNCGNFGTSREAIDAWMLEHKRINKLNFGPDDVEIISAGDAIINATLNPDDPAWKIVKDLSGELKWIQTIMDFDSNPTVSVRGCGYKDDTKYPWP